MSDLEIAKAVAEACGWTRHKMFTVYGGGGFGIYLGDYWRTFDPVNRLNDAFFAAEAVGLFDDHVLYRSELLSGTTVWCVSPVLDAGEFDIRNGVDAETPATAICLAILESKVPGAG